MAANAIAALFGFGAAQDYKNSPAVIAHAVRPTAARMIRN